MRIDQQRMTCAKCGHVFDAEVVMNAPVDVVIASLRAVSCPQCGAREIGLGGKHKDAPPMTAPLVMRADWWRTRGEVGTSSMTIFCAMTGSRTDGRYDFPYDPDDYRRCRRLLEIVPEWRFQLHKVAERFPAWRPFVEAWDQFDALWEEEHTTGRCPKLYEAMQKARPEAIQLERLSK